jgi:hypothetical protein
MMPGYTSDEIQAVVERLVLSTIRRPYDTLGVRRTDISFSDIQEAAAGVFILYPNAPFYVLFLGAQRLNDTITAEAAIVEALLDAIEATGLNVLPIEDVSTLFNAQAALQELGGASGGRAGIFNDITKAPAFQRFSDNVDRFLSGPGANTKNAGTIVQTPQQARSVIPGLLRQLQDIHALLLARVEGIANGIDDYNKVNLPAVVSSSVLTNSARLVGADADALDVLAPTERLVLIRQTVLDILATRAVVTTFGSFSGPSDYYTLDGFGTPFSDALREAVPAVATGTIGGAAAIIQGVNDQLTLALDFGTPFSILLNPSVLAQLSGQASDELFVIGDGAQPITVGAVTPNNNKVKIKVGATTYTATLTVSGASTAAALTGTGDTTTAGWYGGGGTLNGTMLIVIVDGLAVYTVTFVAPADVAALLAQINAVTNPAVGQHKAVATNIANRLVLTTIGTGTPASLVMGAGTSNAILGFTDSQSARGAFATRTADQVATNIQAALPAGVVAEGVYAPLKYDGLFNIPAGVNQVWAIPVPGASDLVALGVTPGLDTVHVPSGPNIGFYAITAVTPDTITVTGTTVLESNVSTRIGPENRRVRIRCNAPATQLPVETLLTIFGDDDPSRAALQTLGFFNGLNTRCMRTTPDLVALDINSKTLALTAATEEQNSLVSIPARTDVLDASRVSLSRARALGTQAFAGLTLTFTVTSLTLPGLVVVGDALVLRTGANPGLFFSVTLINGSAALTPHTLAVGDVLVAVGLIAGVPDLGVAIELGPPVAANKYDVVTVTGGPNAGTYFVQAQGLTPLDIILQRALPLTQSGTLSIDMVVSFGVMVLLLKSKNKTTQSQVVASGPACLLFFLSSPTTARGTTPWFQLPTVPRGLQAGDVLETYLTDYKTPSGSFAIAGISGSVLQLGTNISSATSWQFMVQPPPFARLRVGMMNDYGAVKAALNAWLLRPTNQEVFFENFNRLVNPLLVNTNPTAVQVGSAMNELKFFYSFLLAAQSASPADALDSIIQTFSVQTVGALDALLHSFLEKGASRAIDLLLSGQFSLFFNLTVDGASYAGAFQEAARAVAMSDLPVRRFNRKEAQTSQLIGQMVSPDYEFTAASVNEAVPGAQVDPPGNFGEPSGFGKK